MFNSDKPITKIEDDVLNRGNFSKQLAHAILAYTKTDNFVISLCGRWGSGKTSILSMVLDIQMNHLTNMPSLEWLMSAMDIHYIMMQ